VAEAPTPEEPRALAEEARRERLLRSISDMDDAAVAARWLHATHWENPEQRPGFDDLRLRMVMETGLFVTYARPFTEARGNPPLPFAPTSGLTDKQRRIHEWVLDRRKKSAAHVDRENPDRIIVPDDLTIDRPERGEEVLKGGQTERYRPPTPGELVALAEIAEHLAARYRAEAFGQAD
jgi:hypothetical protein